jgi:hypothetical protein
MQLAPQVLDELSRGIFQVRHQRVTRHLHTDGKLYAAEERRHQPEAGMTRNERTGQLFQFRTKMKQRILLFQRAPAQEAIHGFRVQSRNRRTQQAGNQNGGDE